MWPLAVASAALAETAATLVLCPLETVKLRQQTAPVGTASRNMLATVRRLVSEEGAGALYKGVAPIAMRQESQKLMIQCIHPSSSPHLLSRTCITPTPLSQVPYTVVKLVSFDLLSKVARRAAYSVTQSSSSHELPPQVRAGADLLVGAPCMQDT